MVLFELSISRDMYHRTQERLPEAWKLHFSWLLILYNVAGDHRESAEKRNNVLNKTGQFKTFSINSQERKIFNKPG